MVVCANSRPDRTNAYNVFMQKSNSINSHRAQKKHTHAPKRSRINGFGFAARDLGDLCVGDIEFKVVVMTSRRGYSRSIYAVQCGDFWEFFLNGAHLSRRICVTRMAWWYKCLGGDIHFCIVHK